MAKSDSRVFDLIDKIPKKESIYIIAFDSNDNKEFFEKCRKKDVKNKCLIISKKPSSVKPIDDVLICPKDFDEGKELFDEVKELFDEVKIFIDEIVLNQIPPPTKVLIWKHFCPCDLENKRFFREVKNIFSTQLTIVKAKDDESALKKIEHFKKISGIDSIYIITNRSEGVRKFIKDCRQRGLKNLFLVISKNIDYWNPMWGVIIVDYNSTEIQNFIQNKILSSVSTKPTKCYCFCCECCECCSKSCSQCCNCRKCWNCFYCCSCFKRYCSNIWNCFKCIISCGCCKYEKYNSYNELDLPN